MGSAILGALARQSDQSGFLINLGPAQTADLIPATARQN